MDTQWLASFAVASLYPLLTQCSHSEMRFSTLGECIWPVDGTHNFFFRRSIDITAVEFVQRFGPFWFRSRIYLGHEWQLEISTHTYTHRDPIENGKNSLSSSSSSSATFQFALLAVDAPSSMPKCTYTQLKYTFPWKPMIIFLYIYTHARCAGASPGKVNEHYICFRLQFPFRPIYQRKWPSPTIMQSHVFKSIDWFSLALLLLLLFLRRRHIFFLSLCFPSASRW